MELTWHVMTPDFVSYFQRFLTKLGWQRTVRVVWSMFVALSFFFWPLCCLFFFDLRILITSLVSSNSSRNTPIYSIFVFQISQIVHICPLKFEKRPNKSKIVMFFSKYIDCSDLLTCFSLAQNVTQNWHNIQHKDQYINVVISSKMWFYH